LPVFYRFGGLAGLERGLRTDRHCGLSSEETVLDEFVFDGANHNLAPADTETGASTEEEALAPVAIARLTSTWTTSGRLHGGAFADRKRVFQDNTLPTKKLLSIFQLMWMAYNDFVLFFLTAAAYPGGFARQPALYHYHYDHDRRPSPIYLHWWGDLFRHASHRGSMGYFRCARRVMYPLWLPHAPRI
jgi:hypothetical protein